MQWQRQLRSERLGRWISLRRSAGFRYVPPDFGRSSDARRLGGKYQRADLRLEQYGERYRAQRHGWIAKRPSQPRFFHGHRASRIYAVHVSASVRGWFCAQRSDESPNNQVEVGLVHLMIRTFVGEDGGFPAPPARGCGYVYGV